MPFRVGLTLTKQSKHCTQPIEPNVMLSGMSDMQDRRRYHSQKVTQLINKVIGLTSTAANLDSSERPTGLALISTAESAGRRWHRSCHFHFWNLFEAGNVRHDAGMQLGVMISNLTTALVNNNCFPLHSAQGSSLA